MPIVTLTTDFGLSDFYVGSLKGAIKKYCPTAEIIDISNEIEPQNIKSAAYTFRAAYGQFPVGTIHLVAVDLFAESDNRLLLTEQDGQFVCCPDNGLISLLFDRLPDKVYLIEPAPVFNVLTFGMLVAKTAQKLAEKKPLYQIGAEVTQYKMRRTFMPQVNEDMIKGTLIYIDRFENAIYNITKEIFEQYVKGKPFDILIGRNRISQINNHYKDVEEGELVCFFNAAGYLELALNNGKAASLLGLKKDDPILIEIK